MKEKDKTETPIDEPKTFQDELGGGEFYPDLPRIDFKEVIGRQVLVIDCQLIEDFKTKFGVHDALLMLIQTPEKGEQFTTITSGEVIIKRVMKARREGLLPLYGTITKTKDYYNIL